MRLDILALDGVFDTGLATVADVFTTANELAGLLALGVPPFEVRLAGLRKRVRTAQGLSVPVVPFAAAKAPDWIAIPAIGEKMPEGLARALERKDIADAGVALRERADEGAKIAAACIGTFVLAESGLLDHQQATTTWWLASMFRQRYPEVRLDDTRMLVPSGPSLVTAGAALGHVDMALWLVRQVSPELAATVARYLIVDSRPAQSAYVIHDHLSHADPMVERFERWARRLQQVLGKSPLGYVQDLRVERAVHLLKTSDRSLEQIAALVGYADGVTLRTLLRQKLGRGVREVRMRD